MDEVERLKAELAAAQQQQQAKLRSAPPPPPPTTPGTPGTGIATPKRVVKPEGSATRLSTKPP
eukprot:3805459-Rhodomonas_salina.1